MTIDDELNVDRWIAADIFEHRNESVDDAIDSVAHGLRLAESSGDLLTFSRPVDSSDETCRFQEVHRAKEFAAFLVIAERQGAFGDRQAEAMCLHGLGIAYFFQNEYLRSFRYLYQSAELSRSCGDTVALLGVLQRLAAANFRLANYDEAIRNAEEAFALARRLERRADEYDLRVLLATCDIEIENFESATARLAAVGDSELEVEGITSGALALTILSTACRKCFRLDDAVDAGISALAASRAGFNNSDRVRALICLGLAYADSRDARAGEIISEARLLAEGDAEDPNFPAAAYEIAGFCIQHDQRESARLLLESALARATRHKQIDLVCRIRQSLSALFAAQGDFGAALAHHEEFQKADKLARRMASEHQMMAAAARLDAERSRQLAEVREAQAREAETLRRQAVEDEIQAMEARAVDLPIGSVEDTLTGLYNRRYITEFLEMEIDRTARARMPLSVTIADIDDFHHINACFSHRIGDSVLRTVAEIFASYIRSEDIVARYGGEEFVVVLPGANRLEAALICERIRRAVEEYPWERLHRELRVTISIGVADERSKCVGDLLSIADRRLGQAKRSGKNRLV